MKKTYLLLAVTLSSVFTLLFSGCSSKADSQISFSQLLSQAGKYSGKTITVDGFYFAGFEIAVLCDFLVPSDFAPGNVNPGGTMIWLEGAMPQSVYDRLFLQPDNPTGYPVHYGKVKITGTFHTGQRYGHLDSYLYMIKIGTAETLPWSPGLPTEKLKITIIDKEGNPVSGAKVVSENEPAGQLKVTGLTNSNGEVYFSGIKAGNYSFYISSYISSSEHKEFTAVIKTGEDTVITISLDTSQTKTTTTS